MRLDVHGEPLERVAVDLDPTLHLVSAALGELTLPWSATTDLTSGQSQVVLEFPKPVEGTGRVLQLSAVAPLETGRRVTLPGIHPRNVAWQEATADLLIPDTLVLEQLQMTDCRQSQVTSLPAPLAGESITIQCFRPTAAVEVVLNEPRQKSPTSRATMVQFGDEEITARCVLRPDVRPTHSKELRAPLPAGWTIDAVEAFPTSGAVDWKLAEPFGRPAMLEILLSDEQDRILVRGHRRRPDKETFEASELQMLDFSGYRGEMQLIGVAAAEGSELRWGGAEELNRRDVEILDEKQLQLFPQLPAGPVFVDDDHFAQATVTLERRKAQYTAEIHIDAAVQDQSLTETYTIQCLPDAARVDRLLVHFRSPARRRWCGIWPAATTPDNSRPAACRAANRPRPACPAKARFGNCCCGSRGGAFELRAQRTVPFTADTPLALVSVADATTQRGTLAIRTLGESNVSIRNRGLMSVPAELLQADRQQTARVTYHYQPSGDDLEAEPAISIAPAKPTQGETGAWAWSGQLVSRYAVDGLSVHTARYRIQTAGRGRIHVRLPGAANLHAVWLDNRRLVLSEADAPHRHIPVDLPPGRSCVALTVEYSVAAALPALVALRDPPFPGLDVPVALRQWSVWLPPDYAMSDAAGNVPVDQLAPPTWSQRLFGPIGRGPFDHVFNPLVGSDWQHAFAGRAESKAADQSSEQFVRSLGTLLADYVDDEELTWGQLLYATSESESQFNRTLLIDAARLDEVGLTPQSRVGHHAASSPLAQGMQLLGRAGLVTIATDAAILITTHSAVATSTDQLSEGELAGTYTARPGPLAGEVRTAMRATPWSRFESVELWRARPAAESTAWTWPPRTDAAASPAGWRHYTLEFSAAARPQVRIVQVARMRSLAWAAFLLIVGCGLWKRVMSNGALVALVGCAAALALVVPAAYVPLSSAALLAGVFSLAARLTHTAPASPAPAEPSSRARKPTSSLLRERRQCSSRAR